MRGRLGSDLLSADAAVIGLRGTASCGGPSQPAAPTVTTKVLTSDEHELQLHVALPPAMFVGHSANGKDYSELVMDQMGTGGKPGQPGIPAYTPQFAIPQGANVSVDVSGVSGYTLNGIDLFPRQPDAVDAVGDPRIPNPGIYADKPFTIDGGAYRSAGPFPAQPANAGALGTLRDVRIGGVEIDGGRYFPRTHRLQVFTGLNVTIHFGGRNAGTFGSGDITSPWEEPFAGLYRHSLINYDAVGRHLGALRPVFCGEQVLVVTSPALRPAADALAAARTAAGYSVLVKETGTGPGQIGTTETQIQSFVRGELNNFLCRVRPSYLIIVGDTSQVPTFHVPCLPANAPAGCDIASDLPYAQNGFGTDLFADMAYGRIPAPDLATANTVVNKIVTYETSPPSPTSDFYRHATITSFFQGSDSTDDRTFTHASETVRNAMRGQGYAVDRVYTSEAADPQYFYDGTPLPSDLRKPTFGWNGTTTDFEDDINAGRFLIFHRDHGNSAGWYNPQLTDGDLAALHNGALLPVAFGVNCSSARFDDPSNPSFVERLLQLPGGGAVGAFGDSRDSPSNANTHLALGFFDAIFPGVVPGYGPSVVDSRLVRMGNVLLAGKQYMATQDGLDGQGANETYQEHYLYGFFGDPTMQMWIASPRRFDLGAIAVATERLAGPPPGPGDPGYRVHVTTSLPDYEGTIATLLQNGRVIGKAIVRGGDAVIDPEGGSSDTSGLTVAFDRDGFVAARKDTAPLPPEQSPPPPPQQPQQSTMTINCPAPKLNYGSSIDVNGTLAPARAGAPVTVTYTASTGTTVQHTVSTAADGTWSDSSGRTREINGATWTVTARFAGDSDFTAAEQSCQTTTNAG